MIMELTSDQREIMEHTVNRAAYGRFCGNSDDMQVLVRVGFMHPIGKTGFCPDEYFCLTRKGREAMNEEPTHD